MIEWSYHTIPWNVWMAVGVMAFSHLLHVDLPWLMLSKNSTLHWVNLSLEMPNLNADCKPTQDECQTCLEQCFFFFLSGVGHTLSLGYIHCVRQDSDWGRPMRNSQNQCQSANTKRGRRSNKTGEFFWRDDVTKDIRWTTNLLDEHWSSTIKCRIEMMEINKHGSIESIFRTHQTNLVYKFKWASIDTGYRCHARTGPRIILNWCNNDVNGFMASLVYAIFFLSKGWAFLTLPTHQSVNQSLHVLFVTLNLDLIFHKIQHDAWWFEAFHAPLNQFNHPFIDGFSMIFPQSKTFINHPAIGVPPSRLWKNPYDPGDFEGCPRVRNSKLDAPPGMAWQVSHTFLKNV